jgi:EAL domain-containing protein (putative c-di-GMP-specific phosphodiesterase class I)
VSSANGLKAMGRVHVSLFPSTLMTTPAEELLEPLSGSSHAGQYSIEVSERQIVGDPSGLLRPVQALRDAGILFTLADVGSDRSSLEGLVVLEPDFVRLSRRRVAGVAHDRAQLRHMERLQNVLRAVGATTIATGIEDEEDAAILQELGVQLGQGYLFGEPVVPG